MNQLDFESSCGSPQAALSMGYHAIIILYGRSVARSCDDHRAMSDRSSLQWRVGVAFCFVWRIHSSRGTWYLSYPQKAKKQKTSAWTSITWFWIWCHYALLHDTLAIYYRWSYMNCWFQPYMIALARESASRVNYCCQFSLEIVFASFFTVLYTKTCQEKPCLGISLHCSSIC